VARSAAYWVRKPVPFPKITAVVMLVCPLDSVMAHWSVLLPEGVQTTEQGKQDVLGADVVVVEHPGLFLGPYHDASRVGEPLEHARRRPLLGFR
jgi:hypothetical protein